MAAAFETRNLLVAVDDSDDSEHAFEWALDNLCKPGDNLHLLHVIPAPAPEVLGGFTGIGGVDTLVTADPDPAADAVRVAAATAFIRRRFVPKAEAQGLSFQIEIVRYMTDNDSIGELVCRRAAALNAAAVVMASHGKSRLKEWFVGSVTNYCTHHCRQPLLVMPGGTPPTPRSVLG